MLILTRKVGETLIIGDDITVTICAVKNSQSESKSMVSNS